MPTEKRTFQAGVDKDSEPRFIENGKYRGGLNIRVTNTADGNAFVVENLKGNTLVSAPLDDGINETKGGYDDKVGKRLFYFVWNSEGEHKLFQYKYDTKVVTTILSGSTLNLQRDKLITSVVLVDNRYLIWTDNFNEPSIVDLDDVSKYSGFTERGLIELMKAPPFQAPTSTYQTDLSFNQNNLKDKLYKFRTRYKYKDGSYSHSSMIGKVALPENYGASIYQNDVDPRQDNVLSVTIQAPPSDDVEKIEVIAQSGNNDLTMNNWFLVDTLDYSASSQTIYFKNDGVYQSLDQNEINLIQSFVPQKCQALEYVSSNRLVFANITDGFDVNDVVPEVSLQDNYEAVPTISGSSTIDLSYFDSNNPSSLIAENTTYGIKIGDGTSGSSLLDTISFSGTLTAGDKVELVLTLNYNIAGTLSSRNITITKTASSPVVSSFVQAFADEINATDTRTTSGQYGGIVAVKDSSTTIKIYQGGNQSGALPPAQEVTLASFSSKTITPVASLGALAPVKSFKRFANHDFGIVYGDDKGRKSAVLPIGTKYVKGFDETGNDGKASIDVWIYHNAPSWATRYWIVYTKNTSYSSYVQFKSIIQNVATDEWKVDTKNQIVVYADNNINSIIEYDYQDGDLVRILGRQGATSVTYLTDIPTYLVKKYNDNDDGNLYFDADISGLNPAIGNNDIVLIEILRPQREVTDKIYYEIGEYYTIDTDTGFHNGKSQDQDYIVRVEFTGGGGTGAVAYARVASSQVNSVIIVDGGSGYTSAPTVSFTSSAGSGATGTATISNGQVTGVTVTAGGSGYPITTSGGVDIVNPAKIELDDTGDCYYKYRIYDSSHAGFVEEENFSDFFVSKVTDIGRANVPDDSAAENTKETTLTFSEQYLPETNINGLSIVFGASLTQYDVQYGAILRIRQRRKDLLMYQTDRIGIVPLFSDIVKSASSTIQANNADLLNSIQYYSEEFGLSHAESLDWYANRDYGVDTKRGVVWRLGGDGLTPINYYGVNSFILDKFSRNFELVENPIAASKIWGTYDKRHDEYVMTIDNSWSADVVSISPTPNNVKEYTVNIDDKYTQEYGYNISVGDVAILQIIQSSGDNASQEVTITSINETGSNTQVVFTTNIPSGASAETIIFKDRYTTAFVERANAWNDRYSFEGECMNEFGIDMVSFENGRLYTHNTNETRNNFYGDQYTSKITVVSNENPSYPKVYQNIQEESDSIWIPTSITTPSGQETSNIEEDFDTLQNQFYAPILCDINTPNVDNPIFEGDQIRDVYATIILENDSTTEEKLFSLGLHYYISQLSNVE